MKIEVVREAYHAPVVQTLIAEMADDLAQFYGPATYPEQSPEPWSAPEGAVLVASVDHVPAACGALIRHDDTTAELKRMFTRPGYRRLGLATQVLAALETEARHLGYRQMVLETGVPQTDAQALYRTAGYVPIDCWPPHDVDPTSICFARTLIDS